MIEHFLDGLRRWSDFSGRSSRAEYWWFVLGYFVFVLLFSILMAVFSIVFGLLAMVIPYLLLLVLVVPSLASLVRRLHDTGRSGWWYFISFIPLVGAIVLLVFLIQESQPYANKWGPVPGEDDEDGDLVGSLVGDSE